MPTFGAADAGEPRLLFVYNADGGALTAAMDALHKLISPETYACSLCAITYGAVSMRAEWKDYVRQLSYRPEFLHRDEFRQQFPHLDTALPAILLERPGAEPRLLVGCDQMSRKHSVKDLIWLLDQALEREAGQRL